MCCAAASSPVTLGVLTSSTSTSVISSRTAATAPARSGSVARTALGELGHDPLGRAAEHHPPRDRGRILGGANLAEVEHRPQPFLHGQSSQRGAEAVVGPGAE